MKMILNIFYLLILIVKYSVQQDVDQCLNPYCACDNEKGYYELFCVDFTDYSLLDFTQTTNLQFETVQLSPINDINLNDKLNFKGLNLTPTALLGFFRLNEINSAYNPFQALETNKLNKPFEILVEDSELVFMSMPTCYSSQSENKNQVFSNLNLFSFEFKDVKFVNRFCPSIFQNSSINEFYFTNVGDVQSPFEIIESVSSSFDYKITINELYIEQKVNLTLSQSPNEVMFSKIDWFEISNTPLLCIGERFFQNLNNLRDIRLATDLNLLLKRSNCSTKWMKSINSKINVNLDENNIDNALKNKTVYLYFADVNLRYQEEDFCYFSNFPHNQLVIPLINNANSLQCTCTVYWLYKHYKRYQFVNIPDQDYKDNFPMQCLNVDDLEKRIENCNLNVKYKACNGAVSFSYINLIIFQSLATLILFLIY